MKLFVLHSVSLEDPNCYDKRFEPVVYLGAFSTYAKARQFASRVVTEETAELNKEDGTELEVPTLVWEFDEFDKTRRIKHSKRVELLSEYYFTITHTALDPVL